MDNMQARMRGSEREPQRATAPAVQDDAHRYVSPRPAAERPKKTKKSRAKWLWPLLALFVVAALAVGAWKMFFGAGADGIDTSKYQAVFLADNNTGNNVYVGKLHKMPDGYFKLTDAFYFQSTPVAADDKEKASADLKLVKPGDEIHAPEDTVIIPREQILHYENLKDTGKVAEAIKKYHSEQK